jgi:hypothetical protein
MSRYHIPLVPYICRGFAYDVTAAMLVFQFRIILIKLSCLEHQHDRHGFCQVGLCGLSASALYTAYFIPTC